ncbi:MAG: ATP-binding protein, partial [Anaerolineae bacterium]
MSDMRGSRSNPYVGARPFERGEPLYGRDGETMDLYRLLVAERIVLLHSPSGAGKTSLIQAALIPRLERRGFEVLPAMRVGLGPAPGLESSPQGNRYITSLLACLEGESAEAGPDRVRAPEERTRLATITLAEYLDRRASRSNGQKLMLVFDQFEEILTLNPTDLEAKREFFAQVGEALRGRPYWALFVMRDDHVAALAPYVRGLPTQLGTTYRLDPLSEASARLAIREPALRGQVEFAEGAVDRLVYELCQVRVQALDGMTQVQRGPFVEPIQLQLVCRRLWEKLPPETTHIAEADVAAVGAVDSVLADYYAERVAAIARQTRVDERTIRDWFDRRLITEQGIRGQVLQGPEESQGLENRASRPLVDASLVRAERRRGAPWYELAHDRLIEPVRADNEAWRRVHPLAPSPVRSAFNGGIGAGLSLALLRAIIAAWVDPQNWMIYPALYGIYGAMLGAA